MTIGGRHEPRMNDVARTGANPLAPHPFAAGADLLQLLGSCHLVVEEKEISFSGRRLAVAVFGLRGVPHVTNLASLRIVWRP